MSSMVIFYFDYKFFDNLIFNEVENEVICKMNFFDVKSEGDFVVYLVYVDVIIQVVGFVMNVSDEMDIVKEVYVNYGWGLLQIYELLVKGKEYEVYIKFSRDKGGDFVYGDVVVLYGDKVVVFFGNLLVSCCDVYFFLVCLMKGKMLIFDDIVVECVMKGIVCCV